MHSRETISVPQSSPLLQDARTSSRDTSAHAAASVTPQSRILSPQHVLQLQRTAGNRAVSKLLGTASLQRKAGVIQRSSKDATMRLDDEAETPLSPSTDHEEEQKEKLVVHKKGKNLAISIPVDNAEQFKKIGAALGKKAKIEYPLAGRQAVSLVDVFKEKNFSFSEHNLDEPSLELGPGEHKLEFCFLGEIEIKNVKKTVNQKAPVAIVITSPEVPRQEKQPESAVETNGPEKMKSNARKKAVAASITSAMDRIGYSVFIGGAAAVNIRFGDHREINDLDFKIAKKGDSESEEINLDKPFNETPQIVAEINEQLKKEGDIKLTKPFTPPVDDTNRIDGQIDGVDVSFIRVRSTSYRERGQKLDKISALHGSDLILDKALAIAAREEKWKSDLFDLIHALVNTEGGLTELLTNLEKERGKSYKSRSKKKEQVSTATASSETDEPEVFEKLTMDFFAKLKKYGSHAAEFQKYIAPYFPAETERDTSGSSRKRQPKAAVSEKTEEYMDMFKQLIEVAKSSLIVQAGNMTGDMFGISAALILNPEAHVLIIREENDQKNRDRTDMIKSFYLETVQDPSRIHTLSPVKNASEAYTKFTGRNPKFFQEKLVPAEQATSDSPLPLHLQFTFKQITVGDATGMVSGNFGNHARSTISDRFGVTSPVQTLDALKAEEERFLALKKQVDQEFNRETNEDWSVGAAALKIPYQKEDLKKIGENLAARKQPIKNMMQHLSSQTENLEEAIAAKLKKLETWLTQSVSNMFNLIHQLDSLRGQQSKYEHVQTFLDHKGISATGNNIVLWSRFSGKKGGPHAQHDTSFTGMRQMAELAKSIGSAVIITGDKPLKDGKIDELISETGAYDLTEFWNDPLWQKLFPDGKRSDQFLLFHYLHENGSLKHLGFRSGNLEAYALLGHTVRYMEEEGNQQAGRMAKWERLGYRRITVDKVPSFTGQWVVEHTEDERPEPKPFWIENKSMAKPEIDRQRGFSTQTLENILNYFAGLEPVEKETKEGTTRVADASEAESVTAAEKNPPPKAWMTELRRRYDEDAKWRERLDKTAELHGAESGEYQVLYMKYMQQKTLSLANLDDSMKKYLREEDVDAHTEAWLKELIEQAKKEAAVVK
ncbi:hypothetical protein [Brevibacillus borstelensis]|uniref:hypothetical protein n=1 Tax=Brevibacillus borstelensis TaxID=45462 RepID=UPI0030BE2D5B